MPGTEDLLPVRWRRVSSDALACETAAPGHRLPLIEYVVDGYSMRAGISYYRFTVRSRVSVEHTTSECRSSVLVAIESDAVRILD